MAVCPLPLPPDRAALGARSAVSVTATAVDAGKRFDHPLGCLAQGFELARRGSGSTEMAK